MDENPPGGSEDDPTPDIVDESRFFVLALADKGWGVWGRGRLTEEPLATYPGDDEGFDLAKEDFQRRNRSERIRRGPWLDILRWIALLAGVVWIVTTAVFVFKLTSAPDSFTGPGIPFESIKWWEAAAQIAQPVFLASIGVYVILWLRTRRS